MPPPSAPAHLLEAAAGLGNGPFGSIRRRALEAFRARGLPTKDEESWRYTDVSRLAGMRLALDLSASSTASGGEAMRLTEGEPFLGRLDLSEHPFVALNTACLMEGRFVRIPKGSRGQMIQVVHRSRSWTNPRTLIVAEEGSEATVVEVFEPGKAGPSLTNAVTEIEALPGARLEHVRIQREGPEALHIGMTDIRIARDARVASHAFAMGAALSRAEVRALLGGEGACCVLNGLYLVDGGRQADCPTFIDHAKPHGTSEQLYKGIVHGRSRGVFYGRIRVRPGAQRTDAHQHNHNLLLSREAEADTRPQLQIDADDVQCAHGATVGRLDEAALFYLRARGIAQEAAQSLLTHAFAVDIVDRVQLASVRPQLLSTLCGWLTHCLGHGGLS